MTSSDLDLRLQRFRSRRDEYPHALASALIEAGRTADALEVIHLGLLDNETDVALLILEARAYYQQGELQEAQRALLKAAKANPRDKEPFRWLAQVLIERGDPARAAKVLERAISLDPADQALRQAHARAQRMLAAAGAMRRDPGRASERPPAHGSDRPLTPPPTADRAPRRSDAPPRRVPEPRPTAPLGGAVQGARRPSSPGRASLPGAPAPAAPRPANVLSQPTAPFGSPGQGASLRSTRSDVLAGGRRAPSPDRSIQEDLLSEPLTDPGDLRGPRRPNGAPPRPSDEPPREDDAPTLAMDVPDALRAFRHEPVRGEPTRHEVVQRHPDLIAPPDEDDEDVDESAQTSIVPAARELELLNRDRGEGYAQSARTDPWAPGSLYDEDATQIEAHSPLAEPGEPEPPEQVLEVLKRQGVFEPGGAYAPGAATTWAGRAEAAPAGTPIRRALVIGWALALLAAVSGYFGFQAWLDRRKVESVQLVGAARERAFDGQHESLVEAERSLTHAREIDPRSREALEALLFVQAARTLEEGSAEHGALRDTLARAVQNELQGPLLEVAKLLIEPPEQRKLGVEQASDRAQQKGAAEDARALYVAGRMAQRLGLFDEAKQLLSQATSREPRLALAWLSLGEQARAEGELERAHELLEKALGADGHCLRAELWLGVLDARPSDAGALLRKLAELSPRIERSSDADRMLALSVRAFAELTAGEGDKARATLRKASALPVRDPELLAFFSTQALRAGEGALAYRAARVASEEGSGAQRYEALLAAASLQQGDVDGVPAGLGNDPGVIARARASAALVSGAREALERAKKELVAYRATPTGKDDIEAGALLIRVDLRIGANVESLMPAARAMVERAPEVLATHLALADALIVSDQARQASAALEGALRRAPGSADAHYLLGLAERQLGRPQEARTSFERAVTLAPNHLEARRALGRMLLDTGEYDAALALFRGLEAVPGSGAALGTLGAVEALLGQGQIDEANRRFDALPELVRKRPESVLLRARLALANGKPAQALELLGPLVAEGAETRSPEVLALFGDAQAGVERVDLAAQAYDAALELDPSNPDALLGRTLLALRAERADQVTEWAQRVQAAIKLRARPPQFRAQLLVAIGRAALLRQQLAAARDALAQAVALPGAPAESHFWYAEALARSRAGEGTDAYQRYLELEPGGPYAARARRALGGR